MLDISPRKSSDHSQKAIVFLAHLSPTRSNLQHSLNTINFMTSIISVSKEAERASNYSGPAAWPQHKVRKFIRELEGGRVKHLESVFCISGKVLSTEWIGHIERRVIAAGGTTEEAHLIYDSFYDLNRKFRMSRGRKQNEQHLNGSRQLAASVRARKEEFSNNLQGSVEAVFNISTGPS